MTAGLRRGAACLALVSALVAGAALAQEDPHGTPPAEDPHAGHDHGAAPHMLSVRALDLSAMFDQSAGGTREPPEIPLADRSVRVLFRTDAGPSSLEVRTDAQGRMEVPLENVPMGTQVEFVVPGPSGDSRWPEYASLPLTAGAKPPEELVFIRVHDGPNPLSFGNYLLTATVPDREEGTPSFRVNVIAQVQNASDKLWIGEKGAVDRGTLRFRIPKDFTLVLAQVGGQDAKGDVEPRSDGAVDVVLRERIWPFAFSGQPTMVRLVLSGPWREDQPYDFSFRAEVPYEEIRINLEQGVLDYEASGDVKLEDAGSNPPISGRVTNAWRAGHVHKGSLVGVKIVAGGRIHPRVWYTLGALALVIAGAALLAKALSRGTRSAAEPPHPPESGPPDAVERALRLKELDRRLARGEITSFEHAARSAQLTGGARPAHATRPPAPHAAPRSAVEDIAARVDTADADTLRRDVRTLLGIVRGKGR